MPVSAARQSARRVRAHSSSWQPRCSGGEFAKLLLRVASFASRTTTRERPGGDGLDLPEEGALSGSAKRIGGRVGLWRPQGSLSPPWGTIGWLARLSHLTAQDSAEGRIYLIRGKTENPVWSGACGLAAAARSIGLSADLRGIRGIVRVDRRAWSFPCMGET